MAAIPEFAAMSAQIVRGRVKNRGTMDDRRVHETLLRSGVATGDDQSRFYLLRCRPFIVP
jgi:hypothetical protein